MNIAPRVEQHLDWNNCRNPLTTSLCKACEIVRTLCPKKIVIDVRRAPSIKYVIFHVCLK